MPCNSKSPYEGVKNPCVLIVKLLYASNANAPLYCNDNWLNDSPFAYIGALL